MRGRASLDDDGVHVHNALGRRRRTSVMAVTTAPAAAAGGQSSAQAAVQVPAAVSAAWASTVAAGSGAAQVAATVRPGAVVAAAWNAHPILFFSVRPVFGASVFRGGLRNGHEEQLSCQACGFSALCSQGSITNICDVCRARHARAKHGSCKNLSSLTASIQQWGNCCGAGNHPPRPL